MSTPVSAPVDFLLITALEEERDAVLSRLPGYEQLPPSEDDVRVDDFATVQAVQSGEAGCTYTVILCMVGMGRVPASTATSNAIRRWAPDYVVLVGIAGGLKSVGVDLGDILIAEQIADYESQKVKEDKIEICWSALPVDHRLLEFSRSISAPAWQAEIKVDRPHNDQGQPKRHMGTITTGDKVVAVNSILESFNDQNWPKLIGVEMEAGGAAVSAPQSVHKPGFFMVRCVSDQAGNKASKRVKAWGPYACDTAAAFAIVFLRSGPIPPRVRPPAIPGQPDDRAQEMSKLTFAELEVVTAYVVEKAAKPGVDYTLLEPMEKLKRNGLGEQTYDQIVRGLSKVQLATQSVEHVAKLDNQFPEKLNAGFLTALRRLRGSRIEGDELFDRLAQFACKNDHRNRYRAAGLAVLTYLFEICAVFEK